MKKVKVDFVQMLPVELTEIIVSHLNGNDLLSCCMVSKQWNEIFNRDIVWKLLCQRHGWSHENIFSLTCWKNFYWMQHNWRMGVYKKTQHSLTENECLNIGLNKEYVILCHVFGAQIWKFSPSPMLFQEICCGDYHFQTKISGNSIVIRLRDSLHLYYKNKSDGLYNLIRILTPDVNHRSNETELCLDSAIVQTGCNRLVIIQKIIKKYSILMWFLDSGSTCNQLDLNESIKHILKTIISNNRLYLVILTGNEYRIKIFDFIKETWTLELVAFKNISFGVVPPELQVNDKLIACFSPIDINRDLCYGYSPLKVWDYYGTFITSVILNSGRIDYFAFCLSDEYVIYRSSEKVVKIWQPKIDQEVSELSVEPEVCKIDKSFGSLLVFSYERYFDVWDWKRGKRLYRVETVDENGDSVAHDKIEINEFYYTKQNRNKKSITVFSYYDSHVIKNSLLLVNHDNSKER